LEIYNAIENANYPEDTAVLINTLEGVLYMNRMNDISFLFGGRLIVLVEHQSTINENMPIRILMLIARIYEKILDSQNIYRKNRIIIPKPEFIVLYNGEEDYPDRSVLRLSDAFEKADIPDMLELSVTVYNINQGRNPEILKRSKSLNDYSTFIAQIRENQNNKGVSLQKSIEEAVLYCISHGIMKEFLENHSSEVINMLFTEFSLEDALKISKEEGKEEGKNQVLDLVKQGYNAEEIERMLANT
jgi:hypothetical protein